LNISINWKKLLLRPINATHHCAYNRMLAGPVLQNRLLLFTWNFRLDTFLDYLPAEKLPCFSWVIQSLSDMVASYAFTTAVTLLLSLCLSKLKRKCQES